MDGGSRIVLFLGGLWIVALPTVLLLTGSVWWLVASFVLGAIIVLGTMGLLSLGDLPYKPSPDEIEFDTALSRAQDLRNDLKRAQDLGHREEVNRLRAELTELMDGLERSRPRSAE